MNVADMVMFKFHSSDGILSDAIRASFFSGGERFDMALFRHITGFDGFGRFPVQKIIEIEIVEVKVLQSEIANITHHYIAVFHD